MPSYDAFISYSHARDRPIAAAVQSLMQTLGKPWWQRRKLRVFRDETSLTAEPKLWPAIEAALTSSRFLLLMASREAARSPWVEREVATWLAHMGPEQGPGRLMLALTEGNLQWDKPGGDFVWGDSTPLPPALKGRFQEEPLWIDLRGYRAGTERASKRNQDFAARAGKLAARVLGVPLEELLSEELRQQRRALMLASSAAASLLVMMLIAAWQTRVAQQQRDRAESAQARAQSELEMRQLNHSRFLASALAAEPDPQVAKAVALNALPLQLDDATGPEFDPALLTRLWIADAEDRQRAILLGHAEAINAAAFSPDGTRVVTASGNTNVIGDVSLSIDSTARVWDARTGRLLLANMEHKNKIFTVAFSPDGRRLLTAASDGTAQQWDATTGAKIGAPLKHERTVPMLSAVFNADGTRILTASFDGTARTWAAHTGAPIGPVITIGTETATLRAIFSPDGRRIATLSTRGVAQLWDAVTGAGLGADIGSPGEKITSIEFSPDGTRLLTASTDRSSRLWNAEDGAPTDHPLQHDGAVWSAVFSSDGAVVLTASGDHTAGLWEARSGKLVARLQHEAAVRRAIFSRDGRKIVTLSEDYVAHLWDVEGRTRVASFRGHGGSINAVAFSPDGGTVLTASSDHTARLWDARLAVEAAVLKEEGLAPRGAYFAPEGDCIIVAPDLSGGPPGPAPSAVRRAARLWDGATYALTTRLVPVADLSPAFWSDRAQFGPGGERAIIFSGFQRAGLWNTKTGKFITVLQGPLGGPVDDAEFSMDGTRLIVANADGTTRLWDSGDGASIALLAEPTQEPGSRDVGGPPIARFRPDQAQVLTTTGADVWFWNARTGERIARVATERGPITAAAFSPDSARLLTLHKDRSAAFWSTRTLQPLQSFRLWKAARSADISHDGSRVLVEFPGEEPPQLLDAANGQVVARLAEHIAPIRGAKFSSDGTRVLSLGKDGTAQLWDGSGGKLIAKLVGVKAAINSAVFSADGTKIVTAADDGAVQIWESRKGLPLEVFTGHTDKIHTANLTRDGTRLATASKDGTVRVWGIPAESVSTRMARVRASVTYALSNDARQRYALGTEQALLKEGTAPLMCDRLAGDSLDPKHTGRGVYRVAETGAESAKEACAQDVQSNPEEPRLRYQLARALVELRQWPEATEQLAIAERANYAAAFFLHARLHAAGAGEARSEARALELFERAFALGMVIAADQIARLKWEGADGVPEDRSAALNMWAEGARRGDPYSHASAALLYEQPEVSDLGKALFHHAVAAALFAGSGAERSALLERARRAALARTLPAAEVARLMRAAESWKPGDLLP